MKPSRAICDARQWLRLTQAEFAQACGVARGSVTRWEAGNAKPPAWLFDAIAFRRKRFSRPLDWVYPEPIQVEARSAVLSAVLAWRKARRRPGKALHPRYTLLRYLCER